MRTIVAAFAVCALASSPALAHRYPHYRGSRHSTGGMSRGLLDQLNTMTPRQRMSFYEHATRPTRHTRIARQARRIVARHHDVAPRRRYALDANGNRAGGIETVQSALGPITVNSSFAPRIEGFIRDLRALGYHSSVHCYASHGHVRHSLHYSGQACDFGQSARNVAPRIMYHVAHLARKWGLRDGCSFHDCGHIDAGHVSRRRYRLARR